MSIYPTPGQTGNPKTTSSGVLAIAIALLTIVLTGLRIYAGEMEPDVGYSVIAVAVTALTTAIGNLFAKDGDR